MTTPQMPSGQITVADLYTTLQNLNTNLTKALTQLEVINSRNNQADTQARDHELRLRKVEEITAIAAGKALATKLWSGGLGALTGANVSATLTHIH